MAIDTSTPVLVLGGKENALSLVRNLGRHGIPVSVSGPSECWGMSSRYCRKAFRVPRDSSGADYWHELLLGPDSASLHGHILIPCCDYSIDFIAHHTEELAGNYLLDDAGPDLRLDMLDKQRTLVLAAQAGTAAPKFWNIEADTDLEGIRNQVEFPVMVKPLNTVNFYRIFGRKLFIIEKRFDEVVEKVRLAQQNDQPVMVVEMIPGPDSLLSSYYTYIDKNGKSLFHYTKRIVRRHPVNRGSACCHVTEWLPDTAAAGRKFFEGIGFTGLGNIEFKHDLRDGKLKIIEVNARFTAAQELLVRSGAPIDLIIYCHLTGQKPPQFSSYTQALIFWYPLRDFLAFLELWRRNELTAMEWLRSWFPHHVISPLHKITDPMPSITAAGGVLEKLLRRLRA
ncbi:MAG: carboxylate--amine ligase [Gammaproteobacteria bacterium]|nr:MAG: carboxylate--amine ligase [Gammaproteobacteria bacterium]